MRSGYCPKRLATNTPVIADGDGHPESVETDSFSVFTLGGWACSFWRTVSVPSRFFSVRSCDCSHAISALGPHGGSLSDSFDWNLFQSESCGRASLVVL